MCQGAYFHPSSAWAAVDGFICTWVHFLVWEIQVKCPSWRWSGLALGPQGVSCMWMPVVVGGVGLDAAGLHRHLFLICPYLSPALAPPTLLTATTVLCSFLLHTCVGGHPSFQGHLSTHKVPAWNPVQELQVMLCLALRGPLQASAAGS